MGEYGFRHLLTEAEAQALIDAFPEDDSQCGASYAIDRAQILLGSYPRNQADDAQTYVTAVSSVLAEFPIRVVKRVTDPRTGIARMVKFLPSIFEIGEACDRESSRGDSVRKRATRHLKARQDPHYREALEDMLGHPIGRISWSGDDVKARKAQALIKSAVRGTA